MTFFLLLDTFLDVILLVALETPYMFISISVSRCVGKNILIETYI